MLLDNFDNATLCKAVAMTSGRAELARAPAVESEREHEAQASTSYSSKVQGNSTVGSDAATGHADDVNAFGAAVDVDVARGAVPAAASALS